MQNLKLVPTTEKIISENYPYGFKLRTTKTDFIEFSARHGFRHCSTTINPKTGRTNNPKKSTYYSVMVLGTDENNHCKSFVAGMNGQKEIEHLTEFMSKPENFALFTTEQVKFIYSQFFLYVKADTQARVIYTGAKLTDLKPLIEKQITLIAEGMKNPEKNLFSQISFDWVEMDKLKVEGYNPFKVTTYEIDRETNQLKQTN